VNYLHAPLESGKLHLKNRLVMPPMATAKSEADGSVSQALLDYYDEKSQGGYISLVIIEHSYIVKQGQVSANQLSVAEDRQVAGLKKLADIIHRNGSKTVIQINHGGSHILPGVTELVSTIVAQFAAAALRVKSAGFDGVEIHSAHGYLLSQFLSPLTNRRTDEYGGDIAGRCRIHLEIIQAVRRAVGEDFPILLRLGTADYLEGGLTVEEGRIAARAMVEAGVDLLDISGGLCRYTLPGVSEPGYFAPLSQAVKEVVSVPVIVTGGITEPWQAEEILRQGKADLVGVGRAIAKDSAWPQKAMNPAALESGGQ